MKENSYYNENEIKENVDLCDSHGNLSESSVGWSRKPLHNLNIKGHSFRKKKWNYWYIINDEMLFSVTISNVDYASPVFIYFYNFKTGYFMEKTYLNTINGKVKMPKGVRDSIKYKNKEINVEFNEIKDATNIIVDSKNFGGKELHAAINISHPEGLETMNVVIPWNKKVFQYTSKQNCMTASGKIDVYGKEYILESNNTFAGLDFGRGIWPRKIFWNWATFSGRAGTDIIGVNLGGTWTNGTGMCENAVFVNNKVNKLHEDVEFLYDPSNIMKPWVIKTAISNRVKITFTPKYERIAKSNLLGIIDSDVHQMIGSFSGYIIDDDGRRFGVSSIKGCAEEHRAKW